jgi:16S rRNA (guanine527-N7)-methyltransferase
VTGGPTPDPGVVPDDLGPAAAAMFGDRLPLARSYARLLATDGVIRGLIGPREAPRIWDRHLLNCAAVAELVPPGSRVVDVGSGAGLPGLVLALSRPDISTTLVEPLARRAEFLIEAVDRLTLGDSVSVLRARAEEVAARPGAPLSADIVTARAVAPLGRLVAWCLPLAAVGGRLLALKGSSAADEAAQHREVVRRAGGGDPVVRICGAGLIDPPTTVVEVVRQRVAPIGARTGTAGSGGRSSAARKPHSTGRRPTHRDERSSG